MCMCVCVVAMPLFVSDTSYFIVYLLNFIDDIYYLSPTFNYYPAMLVFKATLLICGHVGAGELHNMLPDTQPYLSNILLHIVVFLCEDNTFKEQSCFCPSDECKPNILARVWSPPTPVKSIWLFSN